MDKIENAMFGRFESGNESGPGNRALRRRCCPESAEISLIAKTGEIRQRVPVALHKARIHPVDPEHDQFRALTGGVQKLARDKRDAQDNRRSRCDVLRKDETAAYY